MSSWAVVGGGMLGLALSRRLTREGQQVTLFEARPELGGLAASWQLGPITWDRFYHVILPGDETLLKLLDDLELEVRWEPTATGFYTEGRLYSVSNFLEFLRFPGLSWLDVLRFGLTILYAARIKDWHYLEQVTAVDWLTRISGRRVMEKVWTPLLRAKLGDNYSRVSAAFIWAIIARLYSARRGRMRRESMGYHPGGYAGILKSMEESLSSQVKMLTGHAVVSVNRDGDQLRVAGNDFSQTFDRVVVTSPAPLARRLCPQLTPAEAARLEAVSYQGIVCAGVVLRRAVSPYYVTNIADRDLPFTGVIEMSALVKEFGPYHLIYLPRYVTGDDPALSWSDEENLGLLLEGLFRMHPSLSQDDVLAARVARSRYVLPLPTLNYSHRLPPVKTSVPGLSIVNTAHLVNGTLNVNETLRLAERVAL